MRNFGFLEKFLIFFGIFVFVFLSFVVVFRREWLDNIFYNPVYIFFYDTDEVFLDEQTEPLLFTVGVAPTVEGEKGVVVLNLESASNITGVELFFEKDESLEITDFVCVSPFECLFSESNENGLTIAAITPINEREEFFPGEVVIGEFNYTGSGKIYFRGEQNSFVSDIQNPEINLLDLTENEFLF
jgi:hypothetical protein